MSAALERFRSLPMPVLLPVLFVVLGALWLGIGYVVFPADQPLVARLIGTLFYAGAMTVFFGVYIGRARRRSGGPSELVRMQRAMKSGVVPADVATEPWTAMFEQWHRQYRRTRWLGPAFFGVMTLLVVALALTQSAIWWIGLVFLLGVLVVTTIDVRRGLRTIPVVLDELHHRARTGTHADGPPQTAGAAWTLPDDEAHRP
jgi:hypothetical protein